MDGISLIPLSSHRNIWRKHAMAQQYENINESQSSAKPAAKMKAVAAKSCAGVAIAGTSNGAARRGVAVVQAAQLGMYQSSKKRLKSSEKRKWRRKLFWRGELEIWRGEDIFRRRM